MPFSAERTVRSCILKTLARLALAVMLSIGLAGCGGGGGGSAPGGGQVTIMPDPSQGSPDLVVESLGVSDAAPAAGAGFTLSVRVRNAGEGSAATTTVRFYRSADEAITSSDTQVGAESLAELVALGASAALAELTAPQPPGVYYYGACADVVEGESDEENNCSTGTPVTVRESRPAAGNALPALPLLASGPPPDLAVESPSVSNPNPAGLEFFTFSASVRNAGDGPSPAAAVRFYGSSSWSRKLQESALGSVRVSELAASGSVVVSMRIRAPQVHGAFWYGACVGPVAPRGFDAEYGCSSSVRITVPQKYPDLVVYFSSVNNARPLAGTAFKLSATVRNAGGAPAPATKVRSYRSDDAAISTSDTPVGSARAVRRLLHKSGVYVSETLTAPQAPGTYYYGMCVDAVDGESDTGNNCSVWVRVKVLKPPDLVVETPVTNDAGPAPGGGFTLSATVRNTGELAAAATTARFYRSADNTISTSDTEVGSAQTVSALAASGSASASASLTAPSALGRYYYGVCVAEVSGEPDTANNCSAAVKILVTNDKPNLRLLSRGVSGLRNGKFGMKVGVLNDGAGPSAATTLRFYRSTSSPITRSATELTTVAVPTLASQERFDTPTLRFWGPPTSEPHYYGACVDAVADESKTADNCAVIHRIPAMIYQIPVE